MKIGVVGGGAWGTALAQVCASGGEDVLLWARETAVVDAINHDHENPLFLARVMLSPLIEATSNLADLRACDLLLIVTPAQHVRATLAAMSVGVRPLILCAKGIEAGSQKFMSEVARTMCPDAPIAVLSGPTFAHEVAAGLPTAVTLACEDSALARALALRIARPHFRPYVSADVTGAEIGGAVKNVLAIACGVVAGRGLGSNAAAALIARGFAEMTRFGLCKGAAAETLGGLSGLGDLVLTCSSRASRNFSLGVGLGEGRSAATLLNNTTTIAEGAFTATVLQAAARACGVDMPVVDAVCDLLSGDADVQHVVSALLSRPLTAEA
ncbi:MAG: NAD(P)H-dependent glycerol-3-phosphate dehydrogenase [Sphingomonadaceae bacterium]